MTKTAVPNQLWFLDSLVTIRVRAMSCPAEASELPKAAGVPPGETLQTLRAVTAKYGIEFVGPPLQ